MIRNDRQLANAEEKLASLEAARDAEENDVDRRAYAPLISSLRNEVDEYRGIRDGITRTFAVTSLDEVGEAVIKARLAKGWPQKQLSDALEVSEQMVQKDEYRGYESAGIARLAEIMDVLGYELVGTVRPKQRRFIVDDDEPSSDGTSNRIAPTAIIRVESQEIWITNPATENLEESESTSYVRIST